MAQSQDYPFTHWIFKDFLSDTFCKKIFDQITIHSTPTIYDGTRAGDYLLAAQNQTRFYLTPEIINHYPFLKEIITTMCCSDIAEKIASIFSTNLSNCFLRVEYIEDKNGFYLRPHRDIIEKILTIFVYLGDAPANYGTDFYDNQKQWVKTIPFKHNTGYIFVPGTDTWHGFEKKKIEGVRKALLINYVTFPTDWPL